LAHRCVILTRIVSEETSRRLDSWKEIASFLGVTGKVQSSSGVVHVVVHVDPVRHLIVTATGWGLNPDKDAMYLNVVPSKNDGTTIYKLRVKDVPVDGFWSVSVYNAEGYFVKNASDAYTFNNITAKKDADGSVTIQFGGCDGKVENCLPITKGWNYMVRLYRPRKEILDGTWKFPKAQPPK
jgi:hypothetical protein